MKWKTNSNCDKSKHDNGITPITKHYGRTIKGEESPDITPQQLTATLLQEAEIAWNSKLNPTEFQRDRYQNPDKHPSIICDL
jgi:hypothetical protein